MSLSETIAAFVTGARVPAEAREAARIAVADCIGCIVAGASTDTVRTLLAVVDQRPGPASLLGLGRSASLREAALVNGTAAHALDYDDISWTLYGHPSVVVLPPLMALAEAEGASAGDVLDAYSIGVEVSAKLGRWANPQFYLRGWHATSALGVLGATAAAARLMRLSPEATQHGLAIAASQAAGIRRNFGSMVKPLHAGRAAEAALLSAQLARAGFTGDAQVLEGRFGYLEVFGAERAPTPQELAAALGSPWDLIEPGVVLKRYPSCGATHCAVDALLELRGELDFAGPDVAAIRCGAEPLALKVLQHPRPATGLEGKFSMEFCLAVAAIDGPPQLAHFSEHWTRHPGVQAMLPRIEVVDRPDLGGKSNDAVPAQVEVTLKDGRTAERTISVPIGDPRRPMSEADRRAKFTDCAEPALGGGAGAAWEMLQDMSGADALTDLFGELRFGELRGPAARPEAAHG